MAITLYKFGANWGVSDPSPFCVKLESFLRLNNIEYTLGEFDIKTSIGKAPKKKIPYIVTESGQQIGDSTLIIEHFSKEKHIDMDAGLSPENRAISHGFRRMLDEAFYFIVLYSRWGDDRGWDVLMPQFFGEVPTSFLRKVISDRIRAGVVKKAWDQGIGRHSIEEIYEMGRKDLEALSHLLAGDTWFFGSEQPTLLDIWCHAYIINLTRVPIENELKAHCLGFQNLCAHAERFQELVYPELSQQDEKQAA